MRVRCTATADYRCNAVGDLELECTPEGLCIALRGVSSYREGYAPGPPVHAKDVCVPWPGVYATRLGERHLQLSLDARSFSGAEGAPTRYLPLNRFLLGEFSEHVPEGASSFLRSRGLPVALAGAGLLALGICLAVTQALPHARAVGTLVWAALVVLLVLGALAWRAYAGPRLPAHVVLDELCQELSRYVPHHVSAAAPTPPARSFEPRALSTLLPRSAVAIAITLAAATLAALVGSGAARPGSTRSEAEANRADPASTSVSAPLLLPTILFAEPEPTSSRASERGAEPSPSAAASSAGVAASATSTVSASLRGDDCTCPRHESLPWQAPLARLSPVLVSERRRMHDGHEHMELDLAIVNDSAREASQLNVSVVFFEAGAAERAGHWQTGERPLFFEGPLAPGQAIHLHVEGRGTSFDVIAPDLGTLAADGSDAAPADSFARLASDGARPVRLHATQLLAFLGDARAEGAAQALRASASPAEADYLDRVLRPPPDLGTCALNVMHEANRWHIEACSFNRSDQPMQAVELQLLAFDAALDRLRPGARAPSLLAARALPSPQALPAHGSRRIELSTPLSIEPGRTPRAFELDVTAAPEAP